ncbi:unnamed protein product [Mycena citricolor]|uniref:Uncharacterized protein n=1 Tax=Mycena citricolor TaxID=2018698 RepID=A0AAD2HK29_9AGAR|nr:unnamed protein product [Mycena citricolor]
MVVLGVADGGRWWQNGDQARSEKCAARGRPMRGRGRRRGFKDGSERGS